jgi:hypothetical protein
VDDFMVDTSGTATTLASGESTIFSVTFQPASAGYKSATLHIASNDPDENPFIISLFGIGGSTGGPKIRIERPPGTPLTSGAGATEFGDVLLGAGRDRGFVVRNTGDAELFVSDVVFTGADSAHFSVLEPVPFPLLPSESIVLTVRFAPGAAVNHSATVTLHSDDAEQGPFSIGLAGAGTTPQAVAQQAYLKASNTGEGDYFGNAVALSGETLVVGARGEASNADSGAGSQGDNSAIEAGAAYVFVRNGSTWTQQAYLKAANSDAGDQFGRAVAIAGDTLVVGAPGEASLATAVNGNAADNAAEGAGAAYVFVRSNGLWTQQAYLKPANAGGGDLFGEAVAISGDTILVGASGESGSATGVNGDGANNHASSSGAAYVFVRNGTVWTQQAYLKASNTGAADEFGRSVALEGDTALVGAPGETSASPGVNGDQQNNTMFAAGAAYVFVRTGVIWSQQAYLKSSRPGGDQLFGEAVALSGTTAVVGAPGESGSTTEIDGDETDATAYGAGAAYVFTASGGSWSQQAYLKAPNTDPADSFGMSVAIAGDTLVAGAPLEAGAASGPNGDALDNSAYSAGAAYVFGRTAGVWTQRAYLKASNTDANDQLGSGLAIAGGTIVVGAFFEAGGATGVAGNQADNTATGAGAAYVFTTSVENPLPVPLSIRRDGGDVVITWARTTPPFNLEAALLLPPAWADAGGTISEDGDTVTFRAPIGAANRFFRLRWP